MPRSPLLALTALVAAAAMAGCTVPAPQGPSPLRYRDVVFPAPPTKTIGLTYGSGPLPDGTWQALTLDMYQPTGDRQMLRPAIVLVHGGGFVAGDSGSGPMVRMARSFSKRGYVAVSINYR